jgi:hypothetical protein
MSLVSRRTNAGQAVPINPAPTFASVALLVRFLNRAAHRATLTAAAKIIKERLATDRHVQADPAA